jgi:hypothetical protein
VSVHEGKRIPEFGCGECDHDQVSASTPDRQIRATHDDETITVYQAYPPAIGDAALRAGTFVPPFKRARMTWIKPSLRWMAYRCGWGSKPDQERVLAIRISHEGFRWALAHSCLSDFHRDRYPDHATWSRQVRESTVRIQWDPERGLRHEPLDHRAIQIGLRGEAVDRYVEDWISGIADVTPLMHTIAGLVRADRLDAAAALLPAETAYPLPEDLATRICASR